MPNHGDISILPAGTLIHIHSFTAGVAVPPGDWVAVDHVTESPNGREWCEAWGRISAPTELRWHGEDYGNGCGVPARPTRNPGWRYQGQRVEQIAAIPRRTRGQWFSCSEPSGATPYTAGSYAGRLGGGGSHGAATIPCGDPAAYVALMGEPIPAAWQQQIDERAAAAAEAARVAAEWARLLPIMDARTGGWQEQPRGALVQINYNCPAYSTLRVDSPEQAAEFAAILRTPVCLARRVAAPKYWEYLSAPE